MENFLNYFRFKLNHKLYLPKAILKRSTKTISVIRDLKHILIANNFSIRKTKHK